MATKIYDSEIIRFMDGDVQYITPLKIKYLRPFLDIFSKIDKVEGDKLDTLLECGLIAMMQYRPEIDTVEKLEDVLDIKTLHEILDIAAGISAKNDLEKPLEDAIKSEEAENYWDSMDLAKLESEVFLLGIWKDYEELESSLSLPELTAILNAKREADYDDKKFMAAIQGIDLDEQNGKKKEKDPWQAMKERVFGSSAADSNDITSFTGRKAADAGFGIGMGISYTNLTSTTE